MINNQDYVQLTRDRLKNSLRGQAMMCKEQNDRMATLEQKREEMRVIEQFVKYLNDFEVNQQMIKEYKELQERFIDDGR